MRFQKPCKRCEELFNPEGKYCNFCDNCKKQKGRTPKPSEPEIIRHRNQIRATKRLEAPPQTDKVKPISIPIRKDLCPFCRENMKYEESKRCTKCHHSKTHAQLSKIKSLKEKKS